MQSIANGETQYKYDYLNDLDGRQIVEEVLKVAKSDQRFLSLTSPKRECLWGSKNAINHGWTREKHWWYFHRPPDVDDAEWPA